jgi:restriction system protein
MAIPGFQKMMLPFLKFAADGKEHRLSEVSDYVVKHFSLTPADQEELLPSGQSRLANRAGWCRTHLKNAGLIEYATKGLFRITDRGRSVLAQNPATINLKFLDQFPEHYAWFHAEKKEPAASKVGVADPDIDAGSDAFTTTPEERLASLAKELRQKLAAELLDQLKTINPYRFERVVLDVLVAMGYGGSREEAATVTQKSNDEGVDGLINEDRLGLDRIYVQAKKWDNTVGRPEIQSFVGALAGKHAHKGIFITTSEFSSGATQYVQSIPQRVILIDGQRLAELMIEHNVGVSRSYVHEIKRVDNDYFGEE